MGTCGTLRGVGRAMSKPKGWGVEWGGAGLACMLSGLQIGVHNQLALLENVLLPLSLPASPPHCSLHCVCC